MCGTFNSILDLQQATPSGTQAYSPYFQFYPRFAVVVARLTCGGVAPPAFNSILDLLLLEDKAGGDVKLSILS